LDLEIHPMASLFPLVNGIKFDKLVEDIRAYGQHEPIVLFEGKILDGRNRYRACILLGITPRIIDYERHDAINYEDPLIWLVRRNLEERQLNKGQRAALAVDILNYKAGGIYDKQINADRDNDAVRELKAVAQLVDAGWTSIDRVRHIYQRRPELLDALRAGITSVAMASRDAGYIDYGPDSTLPGISSEQYGRGDKFWESTEPIQRYLGAWRGRGFEFRHVNPKEAASRLKQIDRIIDSLMEARKDLADRAKKSELRTR
jgi:hypothetical protein